MSKLISSSACQQGPRPASVSATSEILDNKMLSAKDSRKRRRSSSSMDNSTVVVVERALFTVAGLSSSLDEESGLEPLPGSNPLRRAGMKEFSTALDKELSTSLPFEEPISNYTEKKPEVKQSPTASTPRFKLKPRPQHRQKMDLCRTSLRSSYNTPPPKIFIPFLPSLPKRSSLQAQKQPHCKQKPLPPPPLIPQFHVPASSTSLKDPEQLLRPKKSRRTMKPLSSPPQLIPSFDFGIAAATRDAITPPPLAKRPPAPFRTPPSMMIPHTPLSMNSVETLYKNNKEGGIVVAKPIARRPLITPSIRHNSHSEKNDNSSMLSPQPTFPSSTRKQERIGAASALLSSMKSSAFSFSSSVPSSLLHAIIRRTLSDDDEDGDN